MLGPSGPTIWTVGHSTRTFEEFRALLLENGIELLVDVRHYPTSNRAPWATRDALSEALSRDRIGYEHLVELGGYRKARPDSVNTGWRQEGFRGYADHMDEDGFRAALDRLLRLAAARRTAILCAEAMPWRCHRGLLSDALLVRGARVVHILGSGQTRDHTLTAFAKVHGDRLAYPAARGKAYMWRRP